MPSAFSSSLLLVLCATIVSACSIVPEATVDHAPASASSSPAPSVSSYRPAATARPATTRNSTPSSEREATLPDTPVGRQLVAWIEAFNLGDPSAMERFRADHLDSSFGQQFNPRELAEQDARLFNEMRILVPRAIEHATMTELTVLLEAPVVSEWLRLTIEVAPTAPHGIVSLRFMPAQPADLPAGKFTEAQLLAELSRYLDKLAAADLFSGVVLLAKDGVPIFHQAYGLADRDANIPNHPDTRFNLASINKMFTAVAIAQLAQLRKLDFDVPIATYLPDYPRPAGDKITIHHLLTHTSGLGDYFSPEFEQEKPALNSPREYFPYFINRPLAFEPGARFEYSNAGFIVLGAIIEQVSGQGYFDYIREHIFEPAGMTRSDFTAIGDGAVDRALGYAPVTGQSSTQQYRNVIDILPTRGGPAGGGYSTAVDLLRFGVALQSQRLLSQTFTELVTTGKIAPLPVERPDARYAYGFSDVRVNGQRVIGHNGGSEGANTTFDIFTDLGYTIVVLSNYAPPSAERIDRRLRMLLTWGADDRATSGALNVSPATNGS